MGERGADGGVYHHIVNARASASDRTPARLREERQARRVCRVSRDNVGRFGSRCSTRRDDDGVEDAVEEEEEDKGRDCGEGQGE